MNKFDILNFKEKLNSIKKKYNLGVYDCQVVCGSILIIIAGIFVWVNCYA